MTTVAQWTAIIEPKKNLAAAESSGVKGVDKTAWLRELRYHLTELGVDPDVMQPDRWTVPVIMRKPTVTVV